MRHQTKPNHSSTLPTPSPSSSPSSPPTTNATKPPDSDHIKAETGHDFLVHYAPHPVTGQPYPEIWTPKFAIHPALLAVWREEHQAVRSVGDNASLRRVASSLEDKAWEMPVRPKRRTAAGKTNEQGATAATAIVIEDAGEPGEAVQRRPMSFDFEGSAPLTEEELAEERAEREREDAARLAYVRDLVVMRDVRRRWEREYMMEEWARAKAKAKAGGGVLVAVVMEFVILVKFGAPQGHGRSGSAVLPASIADAFVYLC
ncbi:uncharacterized protein BDZ99DRAFT_495219 [Mytilinidion resinicola]|uniref:Uncharacterized protein n=1 Tax=Mytilinidion resinicola TaxID=574789 RepID=A0A6A6Z2S9_9PEZI|nr:uncharacterized protein BDZ99DRAFT_495219 [Mytilinidion resinicola]KAF2815472.1 hypothetical protein BDZ99DRAFT_495219 [Mytilinidion resinicola]